MLRQESGDHMSIDDDLKLERYKLVADRQKYFTELARASFEAYTKVFVTLSAGSIALVSARSSLGVQQSFCFNLSGVLQRSSLS